jgi:transcriptional regulator GlxA family with amidase domain
MNSLNHLEANLEHLAEEAGYNVEQLADLSHCPRRRLLRFFRRKFACGVKTALDRIRLARASRMLQSGREPKAIATDLGFAQPSNLRRWMARKRLKVHTRCQQGQQALDFEI